VISEFALVNVDTDPQCFRTTLGRAFSRPRVVVNVIRCASEAYLVW